MGKARRASWIPGAQYIKLSLFLCLKKRVEEHKQQLSSLSDTRDSLQSPKRELNHTASIAEFSVTGGTPEQITCSERFYNMPFGKGSKNIPHTLDSKIHFDQLTYPTQKIIFIYAASKLFP